MNAFASFVSPEIVSELGLVPRDTGRIFDAIAMGGPVQIPERYVHLSFTIPGLDGRVFRSPFVVFNVGYSPMVLGYDFWWKYHILYYRGYLIRDVRIPVVPDPYGDRDIMPTLILQQVLTRGSRAPTVV